MLEVSAERLNRLFAKACLIQEGQANGLWLPIIWHLALRRHPDAMVVLANWLSDDGDDGRHSDSHCALGLYRRAYKAGLTYAAHNLAMDHFNRNKMARYRHWLRCAAQAGDNDAAKELRRFETRLPHNSARKIGRIRPMRKAERLG